MARLGGWSCWFYIQLFPIVLQVYCFNLDTDVPIIKTALPDSYFGFSVAQHSIKSLGSVEYGFLVGAPRDTITDRRAPAALRSIERPGVIYFCPLSASTDDCRALGYDWPEEHGDQNMNNQWMGVTVQSQGTPEGKAVVCAHRYKISGRQYVWGLGLCYSLNNDLEWEDPFIPCQSKPTDRGHSQYGFCQSGTSAAISNDGDLLIGAPGPYDWRGALFKNTIADGTAAFGVDLAPAPAFPRWYQTPLEDSVTGSYTYLGMSTVIGRLVGGVKTYAGGAPRAGDGRGQVLLFTQDAASEAGGFLTLQHTLTGDQFGASFGAVMVVIDLNADGKDDLVVGAPFYQGTRTGGAIYIYLNSDDGITAMTENTTMTSREMNSTQCEALDCTAARFGFSLANLGDLDRDGYNDLAVGAPYEGSGVVYVFRGSATGLSTPYSQRIAASDLPRPLPTFGYSLSGGVDMDDNGYPDLVVGAYSGGASAVLRARPVVNIAATMTFYPSVLDPDVTQCPTTGVNSNCFKVQVCFHFTAEPRERFTGHLNLDYKLEADKFSGRKTSRVTLHGSYEISRSVRLAEQGNSRCKNHQVYIKKNNIDFLHAIPLRLTYKLKDVAPPSMDPRDRQIPDLNSHPVLNAKPVLRTVPFKKNCGPDDLCTSDLVLRAHLPELDRTADGEDYVLKVDQVKEVRLEVNVKNRGEDAHEATVLVTLPSALNYLGVLRGDTSKAYACSPSGRNVTCNIGNPMQSGHQATFTIRLTANNLVVSSKWLTIDLVVNTTSVEQNKRNNALTMRVRVALETDLDIKGFTKEHMVFYGGKIRGESAMVSETDIGSRVVHSYEVKNRGPGRITNLTVLIQWPYGLATKWEKSKHLLYLMRAPLLEGSNGVAAGVCTIDPKFVNPLGVKRERGPPSPSGVRSRNQAAGGANRRKREVTKTSGLRIDLGDGRSTEVVTLDCMSGGATCTQIKCVLGAMNRGESVVISIEARLWNSTLVEEFADVNSVQIFSHAEIIVDPRISIKQPNLENDKSWAMTVAVPDIEVQKKPGVPLWVIIVAVVGGVLLLIILIVLLWKCGFFKRNNANEMRTKAEKKKATPRQEIM